MEEKINVAEILKDKPADTKLWSDTFGVVSVLAIHSDNVYIKDANRTTWIYSYDGFFTSCKGALSIFPSRNMRSWKKFAWKKGDLLINSCGLQCIFKEWASDDYTKFNGCYSNSRDGYEDVSNAKTAKFDKLDNNIAYGYVREIERKLGGILNLETLEIEKTHPEFKDGDIVCISGMGYLAYGIVKSIDNSSKKLEYYVLNDMSTLKFEDWLSFEDKQIQPITETQQIILFDALANENMAWDAEKKAIVGLPKKCVFKVFQKVLVRELNVDEWIPNFYFKRYKDGHKHVMVCGDIYNQCIPYNNQTEHLLGTTDEWKGGEG